MTTYDVYFSTVSPGEHRAPYVRDGDTVIYNCDGETGTIEFNGYYYVENNAPPYPEDATKHPWEIERYSEWLPKKAFMSLTHREKTPYKIKNDNKQLCTYLYYNELEKQTYIIEIYKKETYECTDEISEIEDDDGDTMKVCFFPTNKMKLWFRVIEDLDAAATQRAYKTKINPDTLYATKETYAQILDWGENNYTSWYHPVSRAEFTRYLKTLKVGDIIEFIVKDGLSTGVEVIEVGEIYDYPKQKHKYGDFKINGLIVDRLIRVKRVSKIET
jgi:uncharacterized protein YkvS